MNPAFMPVMLDWLYSERKTTGMQTTERLTLEDLGSTAADASSVRWASACPGVLAVKFQPESRELVVTYDLRQCTLGDICRHLARGGIPYDTSLLERFRLMTVDRSERLARLRTGTTMPRSCLPLPLVQTAA